MARRLRSCSSGFPGARLSGRGNVVGAADPGHRADGHAGHGLDTAGPGRAARQWPTPHQGGASDAPALVRRHGADRIIGRLVYGNRVALDKELVRILSSQVYTPRGSREVLGRACRMKAEVDAQPGPRRFLPHNLRARPPGSNRRARVQRRSAPGHSTQPALVLAEAGHSPQLDAPDEIVSLACELAAAARGRSRPA